LLFCAWLSTGYCNEYQDEPAAHASERVFKLSVLQADGTRDSASATLIAPGKLVTNCHVTRGARRIELVQGDGRLAAEQIAADAPRDVCLLAVAGLDVPDKPIGAANALAIGQRVYAIGYPGGRAQAITQGSVLALHDFEGGQVIRTDAAFEPGQSGGGLFDRDGNLVGILTFKSAQGGGFHFAVPAEWLARIGESSPKSDTARAFWERPSKQQPAFLRAAALESAQDWRALLKLGRQWVSDEPANAEAWMARAKGAHHHGKNADEAALAYREAARLRDNTQLAGEDRVYGCAPSCVAASSAPAEPDLSARIGEN
jgi:serine protease Do